MGRKLTSVNYDKGLPLNDLETLLLVCERLVRAKLDSNPKAGIILAKGKPNERRVRYSEAYELLVGLSDYFGIKGAFSLGTCDSCTNFKRSRSNPAFGKCKAKSGDSASVHQWDSCPGHKGGGIS